MAMEFAWSSEQIFGALSAALLIGRLTAPWLGRWIDRFDAGRIMTVGSAIAAAELVACALAPGKIAFVLALIAVGTASKSRAIRRSLRAAGTNPPRSAQRSITYLTLVGGFASTIFWPDYHGTARISLLAERLSCFRPAQSVDLPEGFEAQ
jgi:MFS family permease